MDDRQKEQLAANEDLFRRINENIQEVAAQHGPDTHRYEFLCECSDSACTELVHASLAEYRQVREHGNRFIVAKGHVIPEIERVVEPANDHVVIEKQGYAGRVAIELDNDD